MLEGTWAGTRLLVWNFWSRRARPASDETAATDRPGAEPDDIDLWAWDPDAARWTPVAELSPSAWAGAAVVELSSGAVYDPASNRWLSLPKPAKDAAPPIRSAGIERPGPHRQPPGQRRNPAVRPRTSQAGAVGSGRSPSTDRFRRRRDR